MVPTKLLPVTLTSAHTIDAAVEEIGSTRKKSIEPGRNIAGVYQKILGIRW
jgi:hypothetical protein